VTSEVGSRPLKLVGWLDGLTWICRVIVLLARNGFLTGLGTEMEDSGEQATLVSLFGTRSHD
jgi:hypothetical protein